MTGFTRITVNFARLKVVRGKVPDPSPKAAERRRTPKRKRVLWAPTSGQILECRSVLPLLEGLRIFVSIRAKEVDSAHC